MFTSQNNSGKRIVILIGLLLALDGIGQPLDDLHSDHQFRFHGSGPPPDVWIYWCPPYRDFETWRYLPIILTVAEALTDATGARVVYNDHVLEAEAPVKMDESVRDLANSASKRAVLVLVGFWNHNVAQNIELFQRCANLGAYIVLYQSEPLYRATRGVWMFHGISRDSFSLNASAIWDYSLSNVELLRSRPELYPSFTKIAYVPPSYTRGLDLDVQFANGTESANPGSVGAVGKRPLPKPLAAELGTIPLKFLPVQDWGTMRRSLTEYPLQLVYHRGSDGRYSPFEAFREYFCFFLLAKAFMCREQEALCSQRTRPAFSRNNLMKATKTTGNTSFFSFLQNRVRRRS